MKIKISTHAAVCLLAPGLVLGLAGCNAAPLLTTGSLSATPTAALASPLPATATDRALHVGATSARAQRCGFFFDPAALRTNFIAAEATRGAAPETIAKTQQSYDFTEKRIAASITNANDYCTKERAGQIRTALQAALGGNFEPPPKKPVEAQSGIFDLLDTEVPTNTWHPNQIHDSVMNEPGKTPREE